jgi:hypothetical protein
VRNRLGQPGRPSPQPWVKTGYDDFNLSTLGVDLPAVGGWLLSAWRHYQRHPLAPAHPVNCEIRIQSAYRQSGNFGEPYEAGIGERHRNVAVANHQIANRSCLGIQI